MKIQGHLRDYPLTDLLEILANRHESGCLRIEFEPEPALLYFSSGQLVDARMSFLKGFAAVHLAFSRAEARFDFDNEVTPPASAIIDENERMLLSGMLKVRLSGYDEFEAAPISLSNSAGLLENRFSMIEESEAPADEASALPVEVNTTVFAHAIEPAPTRDDLTPSPRMLLESGLRQTRALLESGLRQTRALLESGLRQTRALLESGLRQTRAMSAVVSASVLDLLNRVPSVPRQTLLRAAAVVFAVAIPSTIGITMLVAKKNASLQVNSATQDLATVSENSQPAVQPKKIENPVTPSSTVLIASAASTAANHASNPKPDAKPSVSQASKSTEDRIVRPQPEESPKPPEQPPTAESTSKTIVVFVRVEEGRVAEAWVKESRKGLEAYEATALRLARQRRYATGASRTESVPVTVSINK